MSAFNDSIEQHHRPIIATLGGLILLFLVACLLHDAIPICHYIFGCDHRLHINA